METRNFQSGASASAPAAPGTPSNGYATNGNPGTGTPATQPGAFWFHKIGEELRAVIVAGGLTPSDSDLTQIAQVMAARGAVFQFGSAGQTVADGLTRYLGGAYMSAAESDCYVPLPYACVVKNLKCQASGGGAGNRVYTLRKNGVDTAITATSSGGTLTASNTANFVSFAAGDLLSLKLTTNGGATTATHCAIVELDKV